MRYLYYPIMIALLVLTGFELYPTITNAYKHLADYQWLLYGFVAYFILRRISIFARNEKWLQITSHETTHAIVGMMFFHKIHSLEASDRSGVVYHSGRNFGDIFISLAPYCLPIATYLFLLLRIIGSSKMLYVFDLFIGFTLAFHVLCFCLQTRLDQPDIQKQGYFRSFLFIFVSWFFNATIILLSIRKGIVGAVTYLFPQYWNDIVGFWNFIF